MGFSEINQGVFTSSKCQSNLYSNITSNIQVKVVESLIFSVSVFYIPCPVPLNTAKVTMLQYLQCIKQFPLISHQVQKMNMKISNDVISKEGLKQRC